MMELPGPQGPLKVTFAGHGGTLAYILGPTDIALDVMEGRLSPSSVTETHRRP